MPEGRRINLRTGTWTIPRFSIGFNPVRALSLSVIIKPVGSPLPGAQTPRTLAPPILTATVCRTFWEYRNRSLADPRSADGDCDGLTDYWQVFYGANAHLADTDNDGLLDGAKVFHPNWRHPYENSVRNNSINTCQNGQGASWSGGWTIVWGYDNSGPLNTLVTSDPLTVDIDGDNILDNREYIYGYNPKVSSYYSAPRAER